MPEFASGGIVSPSRYVPTGTCVRPTLPAETEAKMPKVIITFPLRQEIIDVLGQLWRGTL